MMRRFNEWLAIKLTKGFGSMWTAHVFMLYSLIPLIFSKMSDTLLYWSNAVQLWALPVIMVGQQLMSIGFNRKFDEMYEMIKTDGLMTREMLHEAKRERREMKILLHEMRDERKLMLEIWERTGVKTGGEET